MRISAQQLKRLCVQILTFTGLRSALDQQADKPERKIEVRFGPLAEVIRSSSPRAKSLAAMVIRAARLADAATIWRDAATLMQSISGRTIACPSAKKNQEERAGTRSQQKSGGGSHGPLGPCLFAAEPCHPVQHNSCPIDQGNRSKRRSPVLCRAGERGTRRLRPWGIFRSSRLGADQRRDRQTISIHRLHSEISWGRRME